MLTGQSTLTQAVAFLYEICLLVACVCVWFSQAEQQIPALMNTVTVR